MMKILSIPKEYLPHKALLKVHTSTDAFGKKNFTEIQLDTVRIEIFQKVGFEKNTVMDTSYGVMYFDCTNSRPKNTTFSIRDRLVFNNKEYRITSIKPKATRREIHHLEIKLEL